MLFLSFVMGCILSLGMTSGGEWRDVFLLLIFPLLSLLAWKNRASTFAIVGVIGIFLGGYLGIGAIREQSENREYFLRITQYGQEKLPVSGTVEKLLFSNDFSASYRMNVEKAGSETIEPKNRNIGVIIRVPNNLEVHSGDHLSFTGKILPVTQSSSGGFEKYALSQGVYGTVSLYSFDRVFTAQPSIFERIRTWSLETFFQGFPRDIAAILGGMVLGDTSLLSDKTKDAFLLSGISHILVVSGSNIAFVILLITGLLRYIPVSSFVRTGVVILFVLFYSTLVGWEVSVLRATIMGSISFLALTQGNKIASISLLVFVGFLLLLYNPLLLRYDAGFGLSFGATLGILLFYEKFRLFLEKFPIPKWMVSIFGVTFSASIGSLPITVYYFESISTGAILANLLIAIVLGWIMMTSVLYLALTLFGSYILYLFGFLIYLPAKFIVLVSWFFSLGGNIVVTDPWNRIIPLIFLGYFLVEIFIQESHRLSTTRKALYSHQ